MGGRRRWRAAVVLAAVFAMLAGQTAANSAQNHGDRRPADRLQSAIERLVNDDKGPPGAMVLVQRGSKLRTFDAGTAVADAHRPMRTDLHMRIASTAKAYSGATALALVERGVLSLDDTIGQRLPWAPRDWRTVTLHQALHHTSGLPDFSTDQDFLDYLVAHLDDPPPPRQLLAFVADQPLEFRPGSRYQYSNSDNIVVGLMIEQATGRSYTDVLADEVLDPLGLDDTSLPDGVQVPRPRMHGYDREDDGTLTDVTELIAAGYAWASGGIVSTPADQNRFIRGYVGRNLFGKRIQHQQFNFRLGSSEPPGPGRNLAGLGIFMYRTSCGTMFGHTGNTPGYTQLIAASQDGQRSVVVSVNRQTSPDDAPDVFEQLHQVFDLAVCTATRG